LVRAEVLHYGAEVEMVAPEGLREAVKQMPEGLSVSDGIRQALKSLAKS